MKEKRQKVLVICYPDPSGNPRPRRVIELCKSMDYIVDVASAPVKGKLEFDKHYIISKEWIKNKFILKNWRRLMIWSGFFLKYLIPIKQLKFHIYHYSYGLGHLNDILRDNYDIVVVEDLYLLPSVIHFRSTAKVVFDAREYYPKQNKDTFRYRIVRRHIANWICREYLRKCDSVITVSKGLASAYQINFGIQAQVIRSTPHYADYSPRKVDANHIKIVHHGNAADLRNLDKLIDIVNHLDDRFTLDLYLTANTRERVNYIDYLKKYASLNPRICFMAPVPFNEIIKMLNNYDIGLGYIEPVTFNLKHCLPNKLFEFIQGRLMVAIGPSPDMAEIVKYYDCGIISDEFDVAQMAALLNKLSAEDIMKAKMNSHLSAKELCFEQEGKKLAAVLSQLLN